MERKFFEDRIAEIKKAIEQNVLQHNQYVGHLAEAEWHLSQFDELQKKADEEAVEIPDGNIPA